MPASDILPGDLVFDAIDIGIIVTHQTNMTSCSRHMHVIEILWSRYGIRRVVFPVDDDMPMFNLIDALYERTKP